MRRARHRSGVERIADLAARGDSEGLRVELARASAEGVPQHELFVSWIAPAARLLEQQWLDGTRRFAEVSFGHALLTECVRALRRRSAPDVGAPHGEGATPDGDAPSRARGSGRPR